MSQEGCNLGCALQGYRTIALNRFQLYRLIGTRCDKVATLQVLSRDPSVVLIPTASQPHRTWHLPDPEPAQNTTRNNSTQHNPTGDARRGLVEPACSQQERATADGASLSWS
eukprot:TRINITY_DN469_c0_g2_i2.p4 TRINITY_DN469_c0_g2~~TRINITY_DN469_c0_g2_i2.p4  ORF type:complete len:112 (+),score=14.26 TRINITY_DN469_c0_g2_i2:31-366(+)